MEGYFPVYDIYCTSISLYTIKSLLLVMFNSCCFNIKVFNFLIKLSGTFQGGWGWFCLCFSREVIVYIHSEKWEPPVFSFASSHYGKITETPCEGMVVSGWEVKGVTGRFRVLFVCLSCLVVALSRILAF